MFNPNETFGNTYRIEAEIGRGGTSVVYRAYHMRLKKYVVIKRIISDFDGTLDARTEVDILKRLHHPCLPQVYDFLQVGREVYTVMDYIQGQGLDTLRPQYGRWSEAVLRRWLRQLLDTLLYLHGQKPTIVHSDIKPGNIILTTNGNMCLIDFNISLDGGAGKIAGYTANYAAPEQIYLAQRKMSGQPCNIALDGRTDLYSLAATFYVLLTGVEPSSQHPNPPLQKLAAGRYTPGFLAILDRAMAWNPRARYKNARDMLAALDRLKRQDGRYRSYVVLQAVSWLGSAVLLAGGVYCVLRGVDQKRIESYRVDYNVLYHAVQRRDDSEILACGSAILNDDSYVKILEQSPGDHAGILHIVGDSYYNSGNLNLALRYYREALRISELTDPQRGSYYIDCAIAAAQTGDTAAARTLLLQAENDGVGSDQLLLIRCVIEQRENDTTACLATVRQLLDQSEDASLCARGCLVAADACGADTAAAVSWLEASREYEQSRDVLRRLGAAYMDLAAQDARYAANYRSRALDCYKTLCALEYAALEDTLNLAIVQRLSGDNDDSIFTLLSLQQQGVKDYRVSMNLAFAYDAKGDVQNAGGWVGQALRMWRETAETDRESESSEEMQALKALQKKLGL